MDQATTRFIILLSTVEASTDSLWRACGTLSPAIEPDQTEHYTLTMNDTGTRPPVRVHMAHPPLQEALEKLRARLRPEISLSLGPDVPDDEVEILVQGRVSASCLETFPVLRAIIVPYAGVPKQTREVLLELRPELPVYNLHHNAVATAELAMALFLAAAKSLLPVDRRFRAHDWRTRYDGAHTLLLEGRTAVVLGHGAIGSRIARACRGLGMRVHAVRRGDAPPTEDGIEVHRNTALPQLLPRADALFIAVPLTEETEGMIGTSQIAQLPSSCVLVNIARGPIVDEQALYESLRDGRLAAAGLDVWYAYPPSQEARANTPPSRFPFHTLENVVMSPPRGGAFWLRELEQLRMDDLARVLNALARGESPPQRVDLAAGY
jgi:phosphoglycerate dehydrogenase-like enzyme